MTTSRRGSRLGRAVSPIRLPGIMLLFALVYGTTGYVLLEGFGLLDALYMTVTTLTTVGFGEIEPLSPPGRAFTITLITIGFAAVFLLVSALTASLASGHLGRRLSRRGIVRRIERMRDHYVICAFGRVGRAAAEELVREGVEVVLVEPKDELEPVLVEAGLPYLIDDPTKEAVLEEAGIRRAKALICAVDSDAVNVYITLTARSLNPELFIISRASSMESVETLKRAGSNRVVSPYSVSGSRMASLALRPAVLEFVDMVAVAPGLRIEELVVGEGSQLALRTVRDVCSPYPGTMILARKSASGELLVPPAADTLLSPGDLIIVVGPTDLLTRMAESASR
ncbi:MAG: potassium channel protein [Actinobacteria bacterium]|nr:potassium channel protein [Actinomycetota bacterium]